MAFMKLGSKPEAFRREGQTWSTLISLYQYGSLSYI